MQCDLDNREILLLLSSQKGELQSHAIALKQPLVSSLLVVVKPEFSRLLGAERHRIVFPARPFINIFMLCLVTRMCVHRYRQLHQFVRMYHSGAFDG